jgi:hypothetical protein
MRTIIGMHGIKKGLLLFIITGDVSTVQADASILKFLLSLKSWCRVCILHAEPLNCELLNNGRKRKTSQEIRCFKKD